MSNNTASLQRETFFKELEEVPVWDVIIIGGGATGLGIAVDAANRGYKTLLLEAADFAKGTSSRSTKLVHGGVRYLAQGNIPLVYDALRERGRLLHNAPHLVKKQMFVIPCYSFFEKLKYLIGLTLYDWLSGAFSFGRSVLLNAKQVKECLPSVNDKKLVGGVVYYDGQFDDARLAINLAQTSAEWKGVLLNYFRVTSLLKSNGKITGVTAQDLETTKVYQLKAKTVINATGVFVDDILQMDEPGSRPMVMSSQGVHLVFSSDILKSDKALMVPRTSDNRVLFAVPWQGYVLVGTTDTPLQHHSIEPKALKEEVNFILDNVQHYFKHPPQAKDILSVFAGLRPLAAQQQKEKNTREISRDHKMLVSPSGLITITGGKWTTYRKMAEQVVDKAIEVGRLPAKPCSTQDLRIHGFTTEPIEDCLSVYGSDAENIRALIKQHPALQNKLVDHLPYMESQVVWAVQHEMARTVEDVLARRIRLLFLDAEAAISAAPKVADMMASLLSRDEEWKRKQLVSFMKLANQYRYTSVLNQAFSTAEVS